MLCVCVRIRPTRLPKLSALRGSPGSGCIRSVPHIQQDSCNKERDSKNGRARARLRFLARRRAAVVRRRDLARDLVRDSRATFCDFPRDGVGHVITNEENLKLQLYTRAGMDGVGIRLAPQTTAAPAPEGGDQVLLFFEGEMLSGTDAAPRARARAASETSFAPEPIELGPRCAFAPRREAAQLVEAAEDAATANAELRLVPRGPWRNWPALVRTRAIAPGEAITWQYNTDPRSAGYAAMQREQLRWRKRARELAEREERLVLWKAQALVKDGRNARGRFVKRTAT